MSNIPYLIETITELECEEIIDHISEFYHSPWVMYSVFKELILEGTPIVLYRDKKWWDKYRSVCHRFKEFKKPKIYNFTLLDKILL